MVLTVHVFPWSVELRMAPLPLLMYIPAAA